MLFNDHLSNSDFKESIVNLPNGKRGVYTKEIPCEFIKEILVSPDTNFSERKKQIKQFFKKEFPNGEFNHIEITESKYSQSQH